MCSFSTTPLSWAVTLGVHAFLLGVLVYGLF